MLVNYYPKYLTSSLCSKRFSAAIIGLNADVKINADNDEKLALSKKHTQFKTRVLKPYPLQDQNGQNHDQNG